MSRAIPESEDDEIVISGIGGRFASSMNLSELEHNLYNKIDMIDESESRWRHTNPIIPKRSGKIGGLTKFDATHFRVHSRQADHMDPQSRILLEHAYESVMDAGINPIELSGRRIAVYAGVSFTESEQLVYTDVEGYYITGYSRAMLANRISFAMNLTGPSHVIDTACSSSIYAIDNAYTAIRNGDCEAAIVCAAHLTLHPMITLQFVKLNMVSREGQCRPFDENSSGYVRSEAICCVFLQKKRDAKRVYATLMHSKTNCDGYKDEGIFFPSRRVQKTLMESFYKEINFDTGLIDYVEAHCTGTQVGDPEEVAAIDEVICKKNRTKPLLIGSVKSNLGHSEPSSGLCSIAKVLLAFQTGKIAPNLHFTKPRSTISALVEGRIKVVLETSDLTSPYVAINSFGFGGANAHILLKGNTKREALTNSNENENIPRLVLWSGRTEDSCNVVFDNLTQRPLDPEFLALLQNIQRVPTPSFVNRGYGLFTQQNGGNAICLTREVKHVNDTSQPLVWVFTGMGSQWVGMGKSLMQLPIIKASIEKSHRVLEKKGLNLIQILTSDDPKIFENILHSFVGIAAIQIAIIDVLRALNLKPDYIIGHSVGELGCAYADDCLTAEQMLLCSYYRGLVSVETKVVYGAMAAVGKGYQQLKLQLPADVEIACHNSVNSSTISGPKEAISRFVEVLKSQDVFAKEVPCSNIPYHSKYIAELGPKLLKYLSKVILTPRKRSARWLSSSVPKKNWETPKAQYCSAEYQANNLLNSVLFEETMALLPSSAVTIEIAPHGLLQAILKIGIPASQHIPLTQRGNRNNLAFFLNALGR